MCVPLHREKPINDFGGDESLEDVWSIACFFIKRNTERYKGLIDLLIENAKKYAR